MALLRRKIDISHAVDAAAVLATSATTQVRAEGNTRKDGDKAMAIDVILDTHISRFEAAFAVRPQNRHEPGVLLKQAVVQGRVFPC